jgi:hypothetical protein
MAIDALPGTGTIRFVSYDSTERGTRRSGSNSGASHTHKDHIKTQKSPYKRLELQNAIGFNPSPNRTASLFPNTRKKDASKTT